MGGEFGFALLTLLLQRHARVDAAARAGAADGGRRSACCSGRCSCATTGASRTASCGRETVAPSTVALETAATREIARREHVIICGFGRVGQNLARVLEQRGFEYIALDLDPFRVRDARQAGDPVVYGDATHPEVLRALGLEQASVVVISFADAETALRIVRAVRRLRADVPVLVRTEDDTQLEQLQAAGATEVVPEIFETSLSLVSHVLLLPARARRRRSLETTEEIRTNATRSCAACSAGAMREPLDATTHGIASSCTRSCCRRGARRRAVNPRPRPRARRRRRHRDPARGHRRVAIPTPTRGCAKATCSCCWAPPRTSSTGSRAC